MEKKNIHSTLYKFGKKYYMKFFNINIDLLKEGKKRGGGF